MKRLLPLLLLVSCATPRVVTRENVRVIEHTEYIPIEIELPPVPEIKEHIFTRDTSSHLENEYAVSDAIIHRDGTLEHSLSTKPQKRTETVKVPMIQRDSIVYQTEVVEKFVEKKLNWWQKFRQDGFFVLCLLLLWAYRKKIIALIK